MFIKLVLLSAIFLPMGVALGFREQTLVAIVILCGAPSTASGYVMAKNMGGDHVLSSSIIVLSTALSAVTLTLTLFILRSMALIQRKFFAFEARGTPAVSPGKPKG